jgi:hypothetical protein
MSKIISFLLLIILFSCSNEKEIDTEDEVKNGIGTVWLSGGLYFCATQIRMEKGDTLIPVGEPEIMFYKSGMRINVTYTELHTKELGCSIGKDCKIIDYEVIE